MDLKKQIKLLESHIKNPSKGLPEEIFLFVSRITPLINVDLLIKNKQKETLLTWRDDGIFSPGWHVPGGIIRHREPIAHRIHAVALNELGARVKVKQPPLAMNELVVTTKSVRGHTISLLYACELISPLDPDLKYEKGTPKPGEWTWHRKCPRNLISVHRIYRKFF